MTDPLDTLRPEVREPWNRIVADEQHPEDFECVEAELLRLADENKRMRGIIETLDIEGHRRAEKAEAELAALEARIAEAHVEEWVDEAGATVHMAFVPLLQNESPSALIHEPQDDNAQEGRSRE